MERFWFFKKISFPWTKLKEWQRLRTRLASKSWATTANSECRSLLHTFLVSCPIAFLNLLRSPAAKLTHLSLNYLIQFYYHRFRWFGKQNTRGSISKISLSYRQVGSKSTNHSHYCDLQTFFTSCYRAVIGGFRSDLSICHLFENLLAASYSRRVSDLKVPINILTPSPHVSGYFWIRNFF